MNFSTGLGNKFENGSRNGEDSMKHCTLEELYQYSKQSLLVN